MENPIRKSVANLNGRLSGLPPTREKKEAKPYLKKKGAATSPPTWAPKTKEEAKPLPKKRQPAWPPNHQDYQKRCAFRSAIRSFDGRAVVVNVCEHMLGVSELRNRKATATQDRCRMGSNMKTDRN